MGIFERFMSLWVALAILVGAALGWLFPGALESVAQLEFAHVNLVIAVFIWLMIYPMMVQIDFSSLRQVTDQPKGLALTLVVNWLIKPFTMLGMGWLFFRVIFAPWVDPVTATEYIAGMVLLGVAPCTAMVFVWSQLTRGNPNYTLVQVSVNDVIMVIAFAPLAAFLLGVTDIAVPWQTLLLSVMLYVVLPLLAGVLTRHWLNRRGQAGQLDAFLDQTLVQSGWPVVCLAGSNPARTPPGDRHDCHPVNTPDIRHLYHCVYWCLVAAVATRHRSAGLSDRNVEFF